MKAICAVGKWDLSDGNEILEQWLRGAQQLQGFLLVSCPPELLQGAAGQLFGHGAFHVWIPALKVSLAAG